METMLCSSNCFAIFFKTFGCAVQAVGPRACTCDAPSVKLRQRPLCTLFNPFLIPLRVKTAYDHMGCELFRSLVLLYATFVLVRRENDRDSIGTLTTTGSQIDYCSR